MKRVIIFSLFTLALLFASMQAFAQAYTYDNMNRLTKVVYENGTTITYTFDALGNRTGKKVTGADPIVITAKSYTRSYGEANPTFEFEVSGGELTGTPEITCETNESSPVGTYDIVISKGTVKNYNVTYVNGTLTIKQTPLTIAAGSYTKKQGDLMPEFTLAYDGFKNNETKDVLTKQPVVNCSANESSAPGEYAVTVSGAEAKNYAISYTNGKLIVTDADPVAVTANSYTIAYGDAIPEFGYSSSGAALNGTPNISCEATSSSPVGTYPITISKGSVTNYNDTYVNGTLTITKASLSIAAGTYTKKQGDPMPEFTLTYDGFKNNETKDVLTKQPVVNCSANESSAPGEYAVTVSDAEAKNYAISYTNGKLIVTDADAVTITANSYTIAYGDAIPDFGYSSSGATLNGTPSISCEATSSSPVGTYPIIISKGSVTNYNDTYINGTLTITKAPLTITAKSYSIKQGETLPTFEVEYSGFKNNETSDVLITPPTITCEATSSSAPGQYDIVVSGAAAQNYEISYTNGTLTITEADAVIVTAISYTRVYGDDNPDFDFTVEDAALEGKPEIICEATATSPVGTYPIIIRKGSVKNYNVTYINGTLTITQAPLTISVGSYTKREGDPMPEFTLTYDGFKNNETEDVLTKKPVVSCEADETSAPGEYSIIVSGAEAQNYVISYVYGKLIVTELSNFTLTYIVDGETYKMFSIKEGSAITPEPEPTKEGYTFSGWSEIPETMPAHDVKVMGYFTINRYVLTYMIDEVVYKNVEYEYGAPITPEPQPEGDYIRFEWVGLPETMPAHDVTVYADYETGIGTLTNDCYERYYRMDGTEAESLSKGFYIVIRKNADGSRSIKKIFVR